MLREGGGQRRGSSIHRNARWIGNGQCEFAIVRMLVVVEELCHEAPDAFVSPRERVVDRVAQLRNARPTPTAR